ncbi:LAME_0E07536g1_1 [Lachancea meyersii CBS 8951]|uniref:LAME_0E07536g1_1 n=1 Tax=Lachancea meyersii CBS 8951 TaxID=1266667 RepID=A0A1G4JIT5_9SACH|nr:LAME_0E07536g1_1 [Lachancea meyersii CBS 8951]
MDNCKPKTESWLLQSLTKFIALVAHLGLPPKSSEAGNGKLVANYLRLNLLSQLRQQQAVSKAERPLEPKERDLLIQWWITLLNFLNSDSRGPEQDEIPPLLTIEVCSVTLESISRILTLVGLAASSQHELDTLAYHTLLTVHYVTNRLIFNTKKRKFILSNKQLGPAHAKQQLTYHNQYNQLLNSFMGKLMAYAFFYLDASFDYEYLLLRFLEPGVCVIDHSFPAFPWKHKDYKLAGQGLFKSLPYTLAEQDRKIFQVVISYLKNDTVFMAFYWHYWHIALNTLGAQNIKVIDQASIPGCKVITRYVGKNLHCDIMAFTRFMKSQEIDGFHHTRPNGQAFSITGEQIDNFVFSNFKTVKLWECVRSLTGSLHPAFPDQLYAFIKFHDNIMLQKLAKIPAHDYQLGNLIYNRLLQFVLFQFNSMGSYLLALNWRKWCQGLTRMLRTLNVSCQSVALVSLFNMWDYIPADQKLRDEFVSILVIDMWEILAENTIFDIVRILFFKIVVFRLLNTANSDGLEVMKDRVVRNLQEAHVRAVALAHEIPTEMLPTPSTDVLLFHINRKLVLSKVDLPSEERVLKELESNVKNLDEDRRIILRSVVMTANVRPLTVLLRGRYPFDILDDMVLKAAKKAAKQRSQGIVSHPYQRSRSTSVSSKSTNDSLADEEHDTSVASALGSFLSKFGSSNSKTPKKTKVSLTERFTRSVGSSDSRAKSESNSNSDVKLDSESTEMISMYSSLSAASSLSAHRSGSSLELKAHQSIPSRDSLTLRKSSIKDAQDVSTVPQPQKKKKLLAPPELKFSGDIGKAAPVKWMFRAITAPMSGLGSSAGQIVQEANNKWGIASARTYDKPLPPTKETVGRDMDDGFDLSPLTDSLNSLGSSESLVVGFSNDAGVNSRSPQSVVPHLYFLGLGIDSTQNQHAPGINEETSFSVGGDKLTKNGSEGSLALNETNETAVRSTAFTMRQGTKLGQLVKMISVFNDTISERMNFMDMVHHSDERIMLDPELSSFRSSQSGYRNLDNARVEYM